MKYYGQNCWSFAAKEEGSGKESTEWCFILKVQHLDLKPYTQCISFSVKFLTFKM